LKSLDYIEFGYYERFPEGYNKYLKEGINDMIGRLRSAGLIQFWYNRNAAQKNKRDMESEPTPLTMDHLTVGFVVNFKLYVLLRITNT